MLLPTFLFQQKNNQKTPPLKTLTTLERAPPDRLLLLRPDRREPLHLRDAAEQLRSPAHAAAAAAPEAAAAAPADAAAAAREAAAAGPRPLRGDAGARAERPRADADDDLNGEREGGNKKRDEEREREREEERERKRSSFFCQGFLFPSLFVSGVPCLGRTHARTHANNKLKKLQNK